MNLALRAAFPSRLWFAGCVAGLLGACATVPKQSSAPVGRDGDAAAQALLTAREQRFGGQPHWHFSGRFAVSDGRDSGSANIDWQQDGEFFTVTVRAPLSAETWRLTGDGEMCQLEGDAKGPDIGRDPAELLARKTGYQLPFAFLRQWVRGVDGNLDAVATGRDAGGRLAGLVDHDWRIEYTRWNDDVDPVTALPLRLRIRRDPYDLRISIDQWSP